MVSIGVFYRDLKRKEIIMEPIITGGVVMCAYKSLMASQKTNAEKLIAKHSCIGGAITLIPVPVVGEIAVIVNQIAMYRGLNKLIGIKFSKNVMKVIGRFLVSQVAGVLVAGTALFAVGAVLKFIPGVNFFAGLAQAGVAGVANYVCGVVYWKMLGGFIAAGGTDGLSDDEIISRMKAQTLSEEEIKKAGEIAKECMKDADYESYKKDAQSCIDEAERNKSEYQ